MEITWLGRSSFRLQSRGADIITDPLGPESGYGPAKSEADIVTLSRRDIPSIGFIDGVQGNPKVLNAAGEYEIQGTLVTAIRCDLKKGGSTTVFTFELDDMKVTHLGLPDSVPSDAITEVVVDSDILLLPVGSGDSLEAKEAWDYAQRLECKVVIPMNYKTEREWEFLETVDAFLAEVGTHPEGKQKLSVVRSKLPLDLSVELLEPR